ncbi:translocation/assembly module TamB domain-containing protein [Parahaliea mediterranea]|uniref:Translocation/assembly module TamB domain-containing protein n=1 Tax=Parahaliea mediterranea TaxID=651086 RepID=A0A939DI04_9GAMM|nr:translocation/assembly module TamB domain-containing protein [Parahaliea mediterranea]MBN7797832.1 translocation/assembly module TamB domain-containing protein [Parahaliea mediterranea]
MRTKTLFYGVLLILLCLLLVIGTLLGLAASSAGSRWLLERAGAIAGGALAWERVEGSLLDTLELEGLRLDQPGLSVTVEHLRYAWRPARLLTGTLYVDSLAARGVEVVLADSGEPPKDSEPFDPAALEPPLDIVLGSIALDAIGLRSGEAPPQRIDRVRLAGSVIDGRVDLARLDVSAAEGEITGAGQLALASGMPAGLQIAWHWRLPDGRRAGGELKLAGHADQLRVTHRGDGELPLDLDGTLTSLLSEPGWDLELNWPALALGIGEQSPRIGPGQLRSSGTLQRYQLSSSGQLAGPGHDPLQWALDAAGDSDGIEIANLELVSGPYQLALEGDVGWAGPISAALAYRARGEGLEAFNADLPSELQAAGRLDLHFAGETLDLERLDLAVVDTPLQVMLSGAVQLPAGGEPELDLTVSWSDLRWPLRGEAIAGSPEGRAVIGGTPTRWRGNLSADMAGSQVPPGHWRAEVSGSDRELWLQALRGALLAGDITLQGHAAWVPAPSWEMRLEGRGLEPGRWRPELRGQRALDLDLDTRGRIDSETGISAEVVLERLAGEIAGRAIDLRARGLVEGELMELKNLALDSGGNRLRADGRVDGDQLALDWSLEAPAPGELLAGAGGALSARGRVSGSTQQPRVQASLEGRELQWQGQSLSSLALEVQAGLAGDAPLRLDLELGALSAGPAADQALLESAVFRARGSTGSHTLNLDVHGITEQLQARFDGGYDIAGGSWRGAVAALALDSEAGGHWQLDATAPLSLSAARVTLADTCLQSPGVDEHPPARFCASGDWRATGGADFAASLESLSLARLLPDLSGAVNGELRVAMAADGALEGRGDFAVEPGELRVETPAGVQRLHHGGGQLDLNIDRGGLVATLGLRPLETGQVRAELQLPAMSRLPLADPQPLTGRLELDLPDLSGLQGWVPELEAVRGRLQGDLRLGGTLGQPTLEGQLALAEAAADVPLAGLELRDLDLRLQADPSPAGQLRIRGGLSSGGGRLTLAGDLETETGVLAMTLRGDRVEVYNTADARALLSPDLDIRFGDDILRLRGKVAVAEARITPKLGLSPGVAPEEVAVAEPEAAASQTEPDPGRIVAPSPDVVILGEPAGGAVTEAPASPLRIDSEVELVLGDRVRVSALGFAGSITGGVIFRNHPRQASLMPTADGRLNIEGGTFRAFGQDLEIETGEVLFRGGPVTEPEVNLRAVRWIDNDPLVSAAGVQVTGPLATPAMELFSRPQLDPTEIQSYLLTGHSAASRESALSIGTYLHPKLYVGYGYNLLEETSEFDALYTITPRYGVEANVGEADNNLGVTITYEH